MPYLIKKDVLHHFLLFKESVEYGIIEYSTQTNNYSIYNQEYKLVYNSEDTNTKINIKFNLADYINHSSYFFEGEDYNKMRLFLEEMSG